MQILTTYRLVRIITKRVNIKAFFEKYKRKKMDDDAYGFAMKTIDTFNETLMKEIIYNNAIFEMKRNMIYIFIAERSYHSHNTSKTTVVPIIYCPKQFLRRCFYHGNTPIIVLDEKWKAILDEEVLSGHKYENTESIIEFINADLRK